MIICSLKAFYYLARSLSGWLENLPKHLQFECVDCFLAERRRCSEHNERDQVVFRNFIIINFDLILLNRRHRKILIQMVRIRFLIVNAKLTLFYNKLVEQHQKNNRDNRQNNWCRNVEGSVYNSSCLRTSCYSPFFVEHPNIRTHKSKENQSSKYCRYKVFIFDRYLFHFQVLESSKTISDLKNE